MSIEAADAFFKIFGMRRVEMKWVDMNGDEIKAGDVLNNEWNDLQNVPVLESGGVLFLGDYDTPFDDRYCLDTFWEIVK
jgi:hypothetical protein